MKEEIESVVDHIISTMPIFKKKFLRPDKYVETNELTPSHYQILFMIEEQGNLTMTEIAKSLMIAKSNLTPLVKKLIAKHYVERLRHDRDRRKVFLSLTEEGRAFLDEHKHRFIEYLRTKLYRLSRDELAELKQGFQSIQNIMSKIE